MNHPKNNHRPRWRRGIVIAVFGTLAVLGYVGVSLTQQSSLAAGGLPDLFGKAQPPLSSGALHVEDLAADPKGYQGTILVRGVMAVAPPNYPGMFAMIDSREARVCRDLKCAKNYLPVKANGPLPQPWDELDVNGKIVMDDRFYYVDAESVDNLGSIKR